MRETALKVVKRLREAGHEAFWVGGCVRDMLLGKEPKDFDVATSALPEAVESLFQRTVAVGRQFGVVVVVDEGQSVEVATFRSESDYQDGRRPGRVEFGDARADALRRDFTVNGLFFDPVENRLHDWVGGEGDLRLRRLRTIGNPAERFQEDHLRLLRAARFAAQLGFEIEAATLETVRSLAGLVARVSAERVRDELVSVFESPHAGRGLEWLRVSGLLAVVLPEIATLEGCEQSPEYHPEGSVYNHVRRMLELLPEGADPLLAWAVLLHDVGKPATRAMDRRTGVIHFYGHERVGAEMAELILRRLKFPRRSMEDIVFCVRHHMQFKDVVEMRPATVRRMLMRPTFKLELELHRLDCLGSSGRLEHYEHLVAAAADLAAQPGLHPPLLNGWDLQELGLRPGPALGHWLKEVRDQQLAGELKSREEAIQWVKGAMASRGPN